MSDLAVLDALTERNVVDFGHGLSSTAGAG
jgi:hypothetical protein